MLVCINRSFRGLSSNSVRKTTSCQSCTSKSPIVCRVPSTHMVRFGRPRLRLTGKLMRFFCGPSRPRTISHGTKEPCSTPQSPMEGRQEGEPRRCCRGRSQGSFEGGGGDLAR